MRLCVADGRLVFDNRSTAVWPGQSQLLLLLLLLRQRRRWQCQHPTTARGGGLRRPRRGRERVIVDHQSIRHCPPRQERVVVHERGAAVTGASHGHIVVVRQ
jgi:hypothetical protein